MALEATMLDIKNFKKCYICQSFQHDEALRVGEEIKFATNNLPLNQFPKKQNSKNFILLT